MSIAQGERSLSQVEPGREQVIQRRGSGLLIRIRPDVIVDTDDRGVKDGPDLVRFLDACHAPTQRSSELHPSTNLGRFMLGERTLHHVQFALTQEGSKVS